MRAARRITLILLILALCLSLSACGKTQGKYKIIKTLEKQEFSIGFRKDDSVGYYVTCALKTMEAEGKITALATQWFGSDSVKFDSDSNALESAGSINPRTLIVGVDENAYPMSYIENNEYAGFDVELAKAVCQRLGWEPKFISIQARNAYVELSSGNVDVAWGGMALDKTTKDYTVLGPYMENELVLATKSDSGSGISGKNLVMDTSPDALAALDAKPKLKAKFGKITRLTGTQDTCFKSLDEGQCDIVLTDSVAVDYANRH